MNGCPVLFWCRTIIENDASAGPLALFYLIETGLPIGTSTRRVEGYNIGMSSHSPFNSQKINATRLGSRQKADKKNLSQVMYHLSFPTERQLLIESSSGTNGCPSRASIVRRVIRCPQAYGHLSDRSNILRAKWAGGGAYRFCFGQFIQKKKQADSLFSDRRNNAG